MCIVKDPTLGYIDVDYTFTTELRVSSSPEVNEPIITYHGS